MVRGILLILVLLIPWGISNGQSVDENTQDFESPVIINWYVEAYPAFYGLGNFKGVSISIHRTVPCWNNFTAGVGIRYYDGVRPEEDRPGELDITSPRTMSLELFLRHWLIDRFYAFYIGSLVGVHYSLKPYVGLGVGGYLNIAGPFYLSGALFLQSRSVEQGAEPLFPRFFGGLAFQIK